MSRNRRAHIAKTHKDQMPLKYLGVELVFDDPNQKTTNLVPEVCRGVASRLSADQYRCGACGIVWDIDEPRPPCPNVGKIKDGTQ